MSRSLQFLKCLYNYSSFKCCYEVAVYTINCTWKCIFCGPNPAMNYNESMEIY
jgi:hypothetical protein